MFKLLAVAMLFVAVALGKYTPSNRGAMENPVLPVRNVRALSGSPTSIHVVPWQVAIVHRFTDGNSISTVLKCSGTIISKTWVLTAAHCLFCRDGTEKPVNVVMAGATDYLNGSAHDIISKIRHPGWQYSDDYNVSWNDIGLIKVQQCFEFGKNRQPIKLYNKNMCTLEGFRVTAATWGSNNNMSHPANYILQLFINILPGQECESSLTQYVNISPFPSVMCGRGTNVTTNLWNSLCDDDSGGPVYLDNILVGIISRTIGICGEVTSINIFTEVVPYKHWISDKTGLLF